MSPLNPAQQRVADAVGEHLVVTAGAGTGKTRALTALFANAVKRAHTDDPAGGTLGITFTEKAAGELGQRIERLLRGEMGDSALRIDPWISTIHGFCSRVLRRHPLEAGVPLGSGVLDDASAELMRREALDAAVREALEEPAVERLLFDHGVDRVYSSLLAVYGRARALGVGLDRIAYRAAPDEGPSPDEGRPDHGGLAELGRWAPGLLREALDAYRGSGDRTKSAAANERRVTELLAEVEARAVPDARGLLGACERARPRRVTKGTEHAFALHSTAVERIERSAMTGYVGTAARAALDILRLFDVRYRDAKARLPALDFEDLQLAVRDLFVRRPDIAEAYRERFPTVLVDESQDTDPLQMQILEAFAPSALCTVGDERQSIYGFRHADVEVFRARRDRVPSGSVVPLDENYRSHPAVLEAVDALFSSEPLFGSDFMPLVPARGEGDQRWGDDDPFAQATRAEALLVDVGVREDEAEEVASRVADLLDGGVHASDVALLLRSRTGLPAFVEALRRVGVPVRVDAGESLLDRPEVRAMRLLLRACANPHDEEALVALLVAGCGICAGAGADGAARLVGLAASAGTSLWEVLVGEDSRQGSWGMSPEDEDAVRGLVGRIERVRQEARGCSAAEAIRLAAEVFEVDRSGDHSRDDAASASLDRLAGLADALPGGPSASILDLLRHLTRLERHGLAPTVSPSGGSAEAVRVMTIHAAKGLEFPVVVVAGLGSAPPKDRPPLALDPWAASGPTLVMRTPSRDRGTGPARATPAYDAYAGRLDRRAAEEERRVLYVACTRAEEVLLVSGVSELSKEPGDDRPIDWVRRALGVGATEPGAETGVTRAKGFRVTCLRDERPGERSGQGRPSARVSGRERSADDTDASTTPDRWRQPPPVPSDRTPKATAGSRPMVPRRPRVSYSTLRVLERCPYKAHAVFVAGLRTPSPTRGMTTRAFGDAAHELLAHTGEADVPGPDEVRAAAARHRLSGEHVAPLGSVLERFAGSPYAIRAARAVWERREERFAVDLGGPILVGDMDLCAWETDGGALVLDHKTGPAPPEGEEQAHHGLQARCYGLAALASGASRAEVVFAHWGGPDTGGTEPGVATFEFDEDDAPGIRSDLAERARRLHAGPWPHLEGYDPAACGDCPVAGGLCPVRVPRA